MFSKILILAVAITATWGQDHYSHGHGHAISSQSIIRHEVSHPHGEQHNSHHEPAQYHTVQHHQPIVHHSAQQHEPTVHHSIQHHEPTAYHSVQHHEPTAYHSVQHHEPTAYHSVQHQEPAAYHSVQHHEPTVYHSVQHHEPTVHHSVQQHQPIVHQAPSHHEEQHDHHDYYAHPKYEFEYKVQDPHTGDNKYQHESRDGDVVKGVYSLHEADGSIRTVEYDSNKHSGFNAYVKHSEPSKHQQKQEAPHQYHH